MTNLPIIHPLLRQLAKTIGLGALVSKNSKSRSQNYPLQSGENRKDTGRKRRSHPLSIPNDTAWASDEHILPIGEHEKKSSKEGGGRIVVAQEISVKSELADERDSDGLHTEGWVLRNMATADGKIPHDRV